MSADRDRIVKTILLTVLMSKNSEIAKIIDVIKKAFVKNNLENPIWYSFSELYHAKIFKVNVLNNKHIGTPIKPIAGTNKNKEPIFTITLIKYIIVLYIVFFMIPGPTPIIWLIIVNPIENDKMPIRGEAFT